MRARRLDVEKHLAVRAGRIPPRLVGGAVHADRRDRRRREREAGEVRGQVGRVEAAAELDDRQSLPGSVGSRREAVHRAELRRRVGHLRPSRSQPQPNVGLRPVVHPEHREHHPVEVRRHLELALTLAVGHRLTGHRVGADDLGQRRAEGRRERLGRTGDGDPARGRIAAEHLYAVPLQGRPDPFDVARVGAVAGRELRRGQRLPALDDLIGQLRAPPQQQRQLNLLLGLDRADRPGARNRAAITAGQRPERSVAHGGSVPGPLPAKSGCGGPARLPGSGHRRT